ncbi:glycosyltransferase family A protein [Rhizomonospora bruguierae]|uniref:glycosyltransferase family A protein n=1 Tax=Rhizomonospora bruguierae TaxID=1581705 RepID=UPI001BCE73F2|nr:glycosyltransferase family A protein [Micromonospora sp. NBRC 107566]
MSRPLDAGAAGTFPADRTLDVLVPTRNRPAELAVTLSGLAASTSRERFGVVVSDQSDGAPPWGDPAVAAVVRLLRHRGHPVLLVRHQPRRGLAEHRASLLGRSLARYTMFLDDDVWLEPETVDRLVTAIGDLGCGFVGNAVHGLSYIDDVRPREQAVYEEWVGRPVPERVRPGTPEWERWTLHNAANLLHITRRLRLAPGEWRAYKVAWAGGCVLYDRAKLLAVGGFDFWTHLPERHQGEDVAAQLMVMSRYGGAGVLPSGAYHLEAPTTMPPDERGVECWSLLDSANRSPAAATTSSTAMLSTNDTR